MDYVAPLADPGPGGTYLDRDLGLNIEGSVVPSAAIEHPMREVVNMILAAGLTPNGADLTQLRQAVVKLIGYASRTIVIDDVTFEGAVADGDWVRYDTAVGEYVKAIADGGANGYAAGAADVTNSKVYVFGPTRAGLFSGLTPGGRLYLSAAAAGAAVSTPPADNRVKLGLARAADVVFVDIDRHVAASASLPRGFIDGFQTSAVGNDVTIGPGAARYDDGSNNVVLAAAITKATGSLWAQGTLAGGLDTGAIAAGSSYHAHAIIKDADGTVDIIFSLSATAPAVPVGWTLARRVGGVVTDAAAATILPFWQVGDDFWLIDPAYDFNQVIARDTNVAAVLSVPTGIKVTAKMNLLGNGTDVFLYVHSPEATELTPSSGASPLYTMKMASNRVPDEGSWPIAISTDVNGQIRVGTAERSIRVKIATLGWTDRRGRDAA